MKMFLTLTAGICLGFLGSQIIGTFNSYPQKAAVDPVRLGRLARLTAESDARLPGLRRRADEATHEQAAFGARLKTALADSSMEDAPSRKKPSNDRFSAWLAGISLSPPLTEAIRAELEARQVAGDEEPLTAGSSFEQWLRARLDADALASWTANQNAHSADKIERRANRLLVGLQSSLTLTPEQKDSIYPQLVEWAGENPQNLLGSDLQTADEQEKFLAARVDKLSALVPAEQREALAEWVAEFLPTYCLEESD